MAEIFWQNINLTRVVLSASYFVDNGVLKLGLGSCPKWLFSFFGGLCLVSNSNFILKTKNSERPRLIQPIVIFIHQF